LSIDKLQSGSYRVRWHDLSGKRRSKTFKYKRDAQEWESEIKRAKQRGKLGQVDADLQLLSELVAEHFAARKDKAARTRSIDLDVWASNVDQRVKGNPERQDYHEIAETPLRLLTPKVIEEWRDEKISEGKGANSVAKAMLIMQAALKRAMRDEKIERNAAALVEKPSRAASKAVKALSPLEVERIRAELDSESALLVAVLAYAGVRPSEARALERPHVRDKTLRVEQATSADGTIKAPKTSKGTRNVRLLKPLADDFKAWFDANPINGEPRIFGVWSDSRWNNWRKRVFEPAAERAGVVIARPYDLRHSAASLWLRERHYLQVALWLGHSPDMTHRTYAHIIEDLDPDASVDAAVLIREARQIVGIL
jgi:integrase